MTPDSADSAEGGEYGPMWVEKLRFRNRNLVVAGVAAFVTELGEEVEGASV